MSNHRNNDCNTVCNTVCNKDWKKIAHANGLAIPDAALEPIARTLDALAADFRPLARALPPETEPAIAFHAARHAASEDAE
jgi:hypothetical protein